MYVNQGLLVVEWKSILIKSTKASLRFSAASAYLAMRAGRPVWRETNELIGLADQCNGCIAIQTETVLQNRARKQLKQKGKGSIWMMNCLLKTKHGNDRASRESIAAARVRSLSIGNRRFAITPATAFAAYPESFSLNIDLGC